MNVKQAYKVEHVSSTIYPIAQLKINKVDQYIDHLLLKHASATMVGLKPANLIYISLHSVVSNVQAYTIIQHLNECVEQTRLKVKIFCNESKSLLLYIYDPIHLFLSLCDIKKAYLLVKNGYKKVSYLNHFYDIVKNKYRTNDPSTLYKMIKRDCLMDQMITKYMSQLLVELGYHLRSAYKTSLFPHEIGIFLGYAIEDVLGFIKHKGKNELYTGYWKIYDDVPQKKQLFDRIKASEFYVYNRFLSGVSLKKLILTCPFF